MLKHAQSSRSAAQVHGQLPTAFTSTDFEVNNILNSNLIEKSSFYVLEHVQSSRLIVQSHGNGQLYVLALCLWQLAHLNHMGMRGNNVNHILTLASL